MWPEPDQHLDVAGYALGRLEPDERARFEAHLSSCEQCRRDLAEFEGTVRVLRISAPREEPAAGLEARTFLAVERAAAEDEAARAAQVVRRRPMRRRLSLGVVGVAALAAAFALGILIESRGGGPGTLELEASLRPPGGGAATASVTVRKTGIGRVIEFRTDDLPILPKGEYYELWFVAAGDTLRAPKRISAGTFHPDEQGRSHVTFAAAVDPTLYPVLSVTAEPGDGNPARTGPEVLRTDRPRAP
jgi:anti-sigma-K factor RskA